MCGSARLLLCVNSWGEKLDICFWNATGCGGDDVLFSKLVFHVPFNRTTPLTDAVCPLSPSIPETLVQVGRETKLERSGVTEQEAPVSVTIGNSL